MLNPSLAPGIRASDDSDDSDGYCLLVAAAMLMESVSSEQPMSMFVRAGLRSLAAAGVVLALAGVATRFSAHMAWGWEDFAAAGALVFSAGVTWALLARLSCSRRQRLALGAVVGLGVLLVWAELAVGLAS